MPRILGSHTEFGSQCNDGRSFTGSDQRDHLDPQITQVAEPAIAHLVHLIHAGNAAERLSERIERLPRGHIESVDAVMMRPEGRALAPPLITGIDDDRGSLPEPVTRQLCSDPVPYLGRAADFSRQDHSTGFRTNATLSVPATMSRPLAVL